MLQQLAAAASLRAMAGGGGSGGGGGGHGGGVSPYDPFYDHAAYADQLQANRDERLAGHQANRDASLHGYDLDKMGAADRFQFGRDARLAEYAQAHEQRQFDFTSRLIGARSRRKMPTG